MKFADELIEHWFTRPWGSGYRQQPMDYRGNQPEKFTGWRKIEWKRSDGPVELRELVRDVQIDLLSDMLARPESVDLRNLMRAQLRRL